MKIDGSWCAPEEFTLGIFLSFGEDEDLGDCHITTIGFGIFAIDIVKSVKWRD
jgi:hypothetical protein